MASVGQRVRLVGVNAGRGLQGRLAAMGLVPGEEIEVIRSGAAGPMVVAVKGCRLVLGRGMAHKMEVA